MYAIYTIYSRPIVYAVYIAKIINKQCKLCKISRSQTVHNKCSIVKIIEQETT